MASDAQAVSPAASRFDPEVITYFSGAIAHMEKTGLIPSPESPGQGDLPLWYLDACLDKESGEWLEAMHIAREYEVPTQEHHEKAAIMLLELSPYFEVMIRKL